MVGRLGFRIVRASFLFRCFFEGNLRFCFYRLVEGGRFGVFRFSRVGFFRLFVFLVLEFVIEGILYVM